MTLFNIPSARRFYERVLSCQGDIYRSDADHASHNLKSEAEYLISSGVANFLGSIDRIDISADNPRDVQMLMRFTSEMRC